MKINRRFKLLCGVGVVPVVFALAFGFGGMVWFNYGNPHNTCATCHEESSHVKSWQNSFHRDLHCRNCHGSSLTLDLHALSEHANRIVQHFKPASADAAVHLSEAQVLTLQEACRNCHPRSFADWQSSRHAVTYPAIFLDSKHNRMEQMAPECLRCHGMFYDGQIEDLVTPLNTKGPWSLKDPAKASQPVIPCLACHQVHATVAAFQPVQLYVRREQTSMAASELPITPITRNGELVKVSPDPRQRLCTQCHAPSAFRELGSQDDRTPFGVHEGLSCLDCHASHSNSAKASCGTCHPADSHCGLDVEKMDTTFFSAASKHNIHFVACGDCHNGRRPAKGELR
jgi:hypothetical protein